MASKTQKKTLRSQYNEIMTIREVKISDCTVLSYKFPTMNDAYSFHFDLMKNKIPYIVFDGAVETVNVIVNKNESDVITSVLNIAKLNHGAETNTKID